MEKKKIILTLGTLALTGTVAYVIFFNRKVEREWYHGLPEAACLAGGLVLGFIIYKKIRD